MLTLAALGLALPCFGAFAAAGTLGGPALLAHLLAQPPLGLVLVFLALMPAMAHICLASPHAAIEVPAAASMLACCCDADADAADGAGKAQHSGVAAACGKSS